MRPAVPTARLASFYLAYYAALGAFTPYWSLYLKERGQPVAAIGVLMSLWYGTRILAPGTWSWLAGRSPRPVRWLRIGSLLTLASFTLFLLPLGFDGLFVAMCLFCFAYNAVMPQFEALTLSHLTGRIHRYGAIRLWGSVGFITVVAGFGLLLDVLPMAWLPLLMLPLLAGLLASSFINEYGPAQRDDAEAPAGVRQLLWRREVLVFFAAALLMQLSFGPYYTFFSIYLDAHGWRPAALGGFWTVAIAAEIALFLLSSRVFRRFDARVVLLGAFLSAVLRWLLTAAFPDNMAVLALAQLTHGLNFAAFFAASMQLLVQYFPGRLNGHGQGIFYGFSSGLGGVLGALLAGSLWNIDGGRSAFLAGAALAASGAGLALWIVRMHRGTIPAR